MTENIVSAVLAFLLGCGIAFLNFQLSKWVIKTRPHSFAAVGFIRQAVEILILVIVYIVGKQFVNVWYPLIGAVLGMTIPMFFFTKRLLGLLEPAEDKKEGSDG